VAEHEDVLPALEEIECDRPGLGGLHRVSPCAQELREREPHRLFVIDDEHPPRAAVPDDAIGQPTSRRRRHQADRPRVSDWGCGTGSTMRKLAPRPGALSTVMIPPCASIMP